MYTDVNEDVRDVKDLPGLRHLHKAPARAICFPEFPEAECRARDIYKIYNIYIIYIYI